MPTPKATGRDHSNPEVVWAELPEPLFNPFAHKGKRLGFFARMPHSPPALFALPSQRFWEAIAAGDDGQWHVVSLQDLGVKEP